MQISLDTSTATTDELTALMALLASLGGRLPSTSADVRTRPAPPPPGAAQSPRDQAEALLQREAARVAANEEDAGEAADPASLDAEGIPWDERIHSSNRARNADSTWRKRRRVDEVTYGRIHAELQAAHAGNHGTGTPSNGTEAQAGATADASAAPSPANSTPAAPPPPPSDTGNAPAPPPPASAPTAAASVAPEPAASASGAGRFADFPSFVQAVNAIRAGGTPYLELNTYAQTVGVAGGFKDMKDQPQLWETFYGMAGGQ